MSVKEELINQINRFQAAPFLFVGSGLSRRYVSLETWEDLLRRFTKDLPKPFEYYRSRADGHLPTVATLISEDFHEVWWNSPAYEESRRSFGSAVTHRDSCLKYEVAKYISEQKHILGKDPTIDEEVELLRRSVIDGIITTNWDSLLESAFPDFKVYIGQESILSSQPQGVAEIYKIHGCSSEPDSLVLTKDDYDRFEVKNPYLAAKLLTIFVEHPVLFLGYSLSDLNVQEILNQLAVCLSPRNTDLLRDKLILVQWSDDGPDRYESTIVQAAGQNIPVTIIRTTDFRPIFEALASVKRKFPARILRNMKEHVYDLVKTNDPTGKMFVVDLEKADEFSDLEIVYGVGISSKIGQKGYAVIQAEDLLNDTLNEASTFDAKLIVKTTLPQLLRGNAKYVPIFKYLKDAEFFAAGELKEDGLSTRVAEIAKMGISRFYPPATYRSKGKQAKTFKGVASLVASMDPEHAIYLIPLLPPQKIDPAELKQFIWENMGLINSPKANTRTYFRSLICLYDWVKYGDKFGQPVEARPKRG